MILVDTNIFLEHLLGRENADECQSLLELLSKGDMQAVVTRFSLHRIEAVYSDPLLADFLRNIDRSLGIQVYDTTTAEEAEVASRSRKNGLDFDDSLQYYVLQRTGATSIVSFDRHFDDLDIPRMEPDEAMANKG
ncbi:MAG: type II toxin-antitoxin system VapC family toxin [Thaumarchaeota archaeon]|nr:type II toxin-antitoxin system VapC family toxin [Nitrososphaerota archaeon]